MPSPDAAPAESGPDDVNPYAVPATGARDLARRQPRQRSRGPDLATPGARLLGFLIDSVVPIAMAIVAIVAMVPVLTPRVIRDSGGQSPFASGMPAWFGTLMLLGLIMLGVNLYLVATRSQTVGKALVRTQIATPDGTPASFARIFFMRWIVCGLATMVASLIPLGQMGYFLVDSLCVLREDRRCVHDHIAGTIVIVYQRA